MMEHEGWLWVESMRVGCGWRNPVLHWYFHNSRGSTKYHINKFFVHAEYGGELLLEVVTIPHRCFRNRVDVSH